MILVVSFDVSKLVEDLILVVNNMLVFNLFVKECLFISVLGLNELIF